MVGLHSDSCKIAFLSSVFLFCLLGIVDLVSLERSPFSIGLNPRKGKSL